MTTFNTGNPIGSTDARDLSDNAENFDKALGTLDATWTDRLGVKRDSFEGRLAKGSFYRVGTFSAGYTLTNMRQTLEYNGHEYSWAGTFPKVVSAGATPATSGGIGAGAWVDRTDVTLRSDLLSGAITDRNSNMALRDTASVFDFGAIGLSQSDDSQAILAAIDYAHSMYLSSGVGVTLISAPGAVHRYTGRLRLKPGVTLDFGVGASAAKLVAVSATGGIELVAGSGLSAEMRTDSSSYTGPMLEINGAKSTLLSFGLHERKAWFNVGIKCSRQVGSSGLFISSADVAQGVAWVSGTADISEVDYPCTIISDGTGYINENTLKLRVFDGVESVRMIVNGAGEIASNRLQIVAQTGNNLRSGRVISCDGQRNEIDITSWDWKSERLNASYDGAQALFTEKSGANVVTGRVQRSLTGSVFSKMGIVDLSPPLRKNHILVDDSRINSPISRSILPNCYLNFSMSGDQDDELAFASNRWSVTGGGDTPPTDGTIQYMFHPNGATCSIPSCSLGTITIDMLAVRYGTDFNAIGVMFTNTANRPDKIKVEVSTDLTTWNTVLQAGYDGGVVPPILHRVDGGGLSSFRYIKLTAECLSAKTVNIARFFLSCHGASKTGGAWLQKLQPTVYESLNIKTAMTGQGLLVDGVRVVSYRRPAIADATSGSEVTVINSILSTLRAHGLIST